MERTCDFDKKAVKLPTFKVEVWLGFIFINFDAEALPLAPRLTAVEDAIANYDLSNAEGLTLADDRTFAWNWKVMFENNNDGYHANKLHRARCTTSSPASCAASSRPAEGDAGFLR